MPGSATYSNLRSAGSAGVAAARPQATSNRRTTPTSAIGEAKPRVPAIFFITSVGLKLPDPHRLSGGFLEYHNPVGVRAFGMVVHAPAVGGLGEFLVIDEEEGRSQSGCDAARHHRLFQLDLSAADFPHFERHVPAR